MRANVPAYSRPTPPRAVGAGVALPGRGGRCSALSVAGTRATSLRLLVQLGRSTVSVGTDGESELLLHVAAASSRRDELLLTCWHRMELPRVPWSLAPPPAVHPDGGKQSSLCAWSVVEPAAASPAGAATAPRQACRTVQLPSLRW